eukprot:4928276-Amphidinium_carterae.1
MIAGIEIRTNPRWYPQHNSIAERRGVFAKWVAQAAMLEAITVWHYDDNGAPSDDTVSFCGFLQHKLCAIFRVQFSPVGSWSRTASPTKPHVTCLVEPGLKPLVVLGTILLSVNNSGISLASVVLLLLLLLLPSCEHDKHFFEK